MSAYLLNPRCGSLLRALDLAFGGGMAVRWPLVGREVERDRILGALREQRGVLLCGAAGVGKTRLAQACLDHARHRAGTTVHATATEALASIPLGALAVVLDLDSGNDELALAQQAVRVLQARANAGRVVLVVDDAHLLDGPSTAVLNLLADVRGIGLVLTVRAGAPMPREVEQLWTSGRVERLDVEPLDRGAVERLISAALDGPVASATTAELWRLSRGNPLVVRETVEGGLDSGLLYHRDGVWQHRGSLASTGRLAALVEQRLNRLPAAERSALELIAVGEPIEHALLERLVGTSRVVQLEERGLLRIRENGRRRNAHAAHPLHREVLRAGMPHARRRQHCGALAVGLELTGMRRREDRLRLGEWRLEAGGVVEPGVLVEASRGALLAGAPEQAVRLAEGALDTGGAIARIALGEALAGAGRRDAAERAFSIAAAHAAGEREQIAAVISKAEHLLYGEHRLDTALAMLDEARATCTDPRLRAELASAEAMFVSFAGDFDAVLRIAEPVLFQHDVSDRARLSMGLIVALSQAMLGQPSAALRSIERSEALVPRLREELPWAETFLGISRMWALWTLGRVHEAERIARGGYQRAIDADAVDLIGGWGVWLAAVLVERGRVAEAAHRLAEVTPALEQHDRFGIMPACLGLRAQAAALLGAVDDARAALGRLDHAHEPGEHRFMSWRDRGLTWLAAAEGDLESAGEHARQGAAWAEAHQQHVWALWSHHDLVRLGLPGPAGAALRRAVERIDTPYVATLAAHATALEEENGEALLAVADRFDEAGSSLLAAEAAGQAAASHRHTGSQGPARATARMRQLTRTCDDVFTLVLEEPPPELTDRELEIARLAVRHLTSPEIAEHLTISVRTVDNHLHRVYAKLGVRGRDELAGLV
ncbi:hypothetical protein ER308_11375 [Egibacter rhizosphaerae]|uniref:HTH luxR-type domain-containing protein n=1 Tax=Egibacter rhizosphaerae TaxID=1670831 RepID=A0A411YFS1_9ACTN|nr:LuxR C-terminal-related transcriptional regulator [Egibacter rhizosphaerae]QBI20105.1 hypothetical protein ER308_11375 [Egibacter rhizosphaerae]